MRSELTVRFDYGRIIPWVRREGDARLIVAGPDALCFRTPAYTRGENMSTVSEFVVEEGERVPLCSPASVARAHPGRSIRGALAETRTSGAGGTLSARSSCRRSGAT
jgi:hypothetical protein